MKSANSGAGALAIMLLFTATLCSAHAQATRTWVSGVGDDANPCSRTAPCKTFAGAISKTAAGGEISVLDPGGYGAVTITKSISIINDYTGEAGILASNTNGITVNAAATDVVILRGIVIDGAPPTMPGLNGIRFINGAALYLDKCLIKNFVSTAANAGNGILFAPSGSSELYVSNTTFTNNGAAAGATSGGAILVLPSGSGSAFVSLNQVQMANNRIGMQINTTGTTGTVSASVESTIAVGNSGHGFSAFTNAGGTSASATINNSVISGNNNGVVVSGSAAVLRLGNSLITGNNTVAVIQSGGQVLSYKNNLIDGNNNNSTPLTGIGLN
ncbi:hypothetical protein [Pseudolabrys sp. FHR47]|uniref:hypothetical protein n=1 Tax=Pseudolabrys sp. FHR47 TaxID=2562284 RepID=UPI0010BF2DEC|nr:hypothetical protein [Pseudolabrys sp. FHR47]